MDFLKIGGKHETIVQTSGSMKAGSVLGTPAGDRTGIVARENDGAQVGADVVCKVAFHVTVGIECFLYDAELSAARNPSRL